MLTEPKGIGHVTLRASALTKKLEKSKKFERKGKCRTKAKCFLPDVIQK